MQHLLQLYMGLRGKYTFLNFARYGQYSEQTYRNHFEKTFAWNIFNKKLIERYCSKELIVAYDPSYLNKSGKKTAHLGWYWSGIAQCVKRGIEIGSLAVIDIVNQTGFSLAAVQTPGGERQKLVMITGLIIIAK